MKHQDALSSASRILQAEVGVGVTEFSGVPAWTPELVEAFFAEIAGALERGDSVRLANFGNFDLRDKPLRPGEESQDR